MIQLSEAVEELEYVPQYLDTLGIFEEESLFVRDVAVETKYGSISLISTSAEGAPPSDTKPRERDTKPFRTQRLAGSFTLYASEVGGMRAFGSESELETVMSVYAERMAILRDKMDLTHEFHRLGALQGMLFDADGSLIYDYWDEFKKEKPAVFDFKLGTATTVVRKKCAEITRSLVASSKGAFLPGTEIHALCGDAFYDNLTNHESVVRTYEGWAAAADLRGNNAHEVFSHGGIFFHNYRGTDDGTTVSVKPDQCIIFPRNAKGVFKKYMSPANEFMPFIGTKGRSVYAMNIRDEQREAWSKGELYSYPLFICTRPDLVRIAK
jgi:hypothetical protein